MDIKEMLKDFKLYTFEGEIYVKAEDYKKIAIENRNLNEEIQRFKDNAMQDMREITELEIENKKLKEKLEWYKTEHERLVDKLVIKGATELLDRKFESKKGWQGE